MINLTPQFQFYEIGFRKEWSRPHPGSTHSVWKVIDAPNIASALWELGHHPRRDYWESLGYRPHIRPITPENYRSHLIANGKLPL